MHRQVDPTSIRRQSPWVQFAQRWANPVLGHSPTDDIVETMAVNCLTGAYGQTEYPSTDSKTGTRIVKRQSFGELEHAEALDARLLLSGNSTDLGRALVEFACTCDAAGTALEPSESELQATYDRYFAEPLSKVEFHLLFLRVKSEQLARRAITDLNSGKSFATVFDTYASPADAHTFPHGDMGTHLETEFPIDDVRLFNALDVGKFSQTPKDGLYGWEIFKLESKRILLAPSLPVLRPRIRAYLMRAHVCHW